MWIQCTGNPIGGLTSGGGTAGQPLAGHRDHLAPHLPFHRPDGRVVDPAKSPEVPTILAALDRLGRGIEDLFQIGMQPGPGMHAVGDRADRHLADVESRPQRPEHLPAHLAVQFRHAVGSLAQPQPQHRHVEAAPVAARVVLRAQREDAVHRQWAEVRELVAQQVDGEPVDACRHRGMRGEDHASAGAFHRGVEIVPGDHLLTNPLQPQQHGVALIGVVDLGCGMPGDAAELPDGAYAADAEQHLLGKPMVGAAAVQLVGDQPFPIWVDLQVGIQEHQRDSTDSADP